MAALRANPGEAVKAAWRLEDEFSTPVKQLLLLLLQCCGVVR